MYIFVFRIPGAAKCATRETIASCVNATHMNALPFRSPRTFRRARGSILRPGPVPVASENAQANFLPISVSCVDRSETGPGKK